MPRKDDLFTKQTGKKKEKRGIVMLKASALVAAIGAIINVAFVLCVQFEGFKLTAENYYLVNLVNIVYLACLIQFFIVFFIKLSTAKK